MHTVVRAGVVGVVAAATVGAGAAQAAQHTSRAAQSAHRITVVERAVSDKVVDLRPKGDSAGDLLTFANPVYDKTNSKRVGRDQGSCIRTVVGKAWECSWTTLLPKGSLMVTGPFYDSRDSVLAITGGTGAYSRARGEMHLHARNKKGTAFTFTFIVR